MRKEITMKKTNLFKRIITSVLCVSALAVPFSTSVSAASYDYSVKSAKQSLRKDIITAYKSVPSCCIYGTYSNQEHRPIPIGSIYIPTIEDAIDKHFFIDGPSAKISSTAGTWVLGDVDYDGEVSLSDLATLRQLLSGQRSITTYQRAISDLNNDNRVNQIDCDILSKYLVNRPR